MALAFFCKNSDGGVIHIHEQDEPLIEETRDEVMKCCVLSGEAVSYEEIPPDSLWQRLKELSEQGVIDSKVADEIHLNYSKREMDYQAGKTRIE